MKNIYLSLFILLSISTQAQLKKVVVEDYTGAWCGYCPEGALILKDLIHNNDPNVIGIANHNADMLEVADGITLDNGFNVSSYPSGTIDRFKFSDQSTVQMSRNLWVDKTQIRVSESAIASVSFYNLVFDSTSRIFDVDVTVVFTAGDPTTYPKTINLGIVEDSIEGTVGIVGLEQHNYISSIGGSILNPWFHNHTLRDWLSGAWGQGGIIPASPIIGDVYTKHYTDTIPMGWDINQIHLVAYAAHNGTLVTQRDILNAEIMKLYTPVDHTSMQDINAPIQQISVYPNPSSNISNIQFDLKENVHLQMKVYDMQGNLVSSPVNAFYNKGIHTIQWDLTNDIGTKLNAGNYIIKLDTENGYSLTRIQVQ